MNKIRDLINKLKRSKNRLEEPLDLTATDQNQDLVAQNNEDTSLENNTSEIKIVQDDEATTDFTLPQEDESTSRFKRPKLPKTLPEFLTLAFWKNHFDIFLARLKHMRLKNMTMPKDSEDLSQIDQPKKINFKFLEKKFSDLVAKLKGQSASSPTQKDISNFFKNILENSQRSVINKTFVVLFIVLSFYSLGKIAALLLNNTFSTPKIVQPGVDFDYTRDMTPMQITQMRDVKLFKTDSINDEQKEIKPVIATNIKCETASRASTLPIKLINTIVLQDSVKSIASVQIRSEKLPQELREGDKIEGMAQIDKIERLNLILKNLKDGSCEYVSNNLFEKKRVSPISVLTPKESKSFTAQKKKIEGIENEGNNYKVSKSFIKDKMKDISSILTQARGIQMTNPDGTIAFKVVEVDPGGIFAYLGIQDNDIITQINGEPISDLNEVMNLFGKITNVDELSLTIKRGGEEIPQDYKFQ